MSKKKSIKRRTFVKQSALGLGAMTFSASSYARILGSNDRVNIAVAGLNSRGQAHIMAAAATKNGYVMAFCDVDNRVFTKSQETLNKHQKNKAKTYEDVRKLLENKKIDALMIATPDHWHAPMAIMAMNAGKHVYLEKPCCHTVEEGEWLKKVEARTKMVLQIGNQQRSGATSIQAMKDIQDGLIGEAYMAKAWYSNTRGSIGVGKVVEVPEWLNWELWQGPTTRKAYKDNYVHYNWHWMRHWGTGEIHNNGLHEIDIARWALGVDYPTKVTSSGGRYHFDDDWEFYDTQIASFEFGDDKMISWEGRSCNNLAFFDRGRGTSIHGTKGSMILDRNACLTFDLDNKLIKETNEKTLSATTDTKGIGGLDVTHTQNFIDGILKGTKRNSPMEEAHKSHLLCHLGNIAQTVGRTLNTDPTNGSVLNDKEATAMFAKDYEKGWKPKV